MGLFRLIATALTARAIGEYIDNSQPQPRGGDLQVVESDTYTIPRGQRFTVQVTTDTPAVLDVNAAVTDGVAARLDVMENRSPQEHHTTSPPRGPETDSTASPDPSQQPHADPPPSRQVASLPIARLETMVDPTQDAFMTRQIPAGSYTVVITPANGQTTTAHLDIKLTD